MAAINLLLDKENVSPKMRALIVYFLQLVTYLLSIVLTDSSNSGTPPSQDPNRKKKKRVKSNDGEGKADEGKNKTDKPKRKPGGQPGHTGRFLAHDEPTEVHVITADEETIIRLGLTPVHGQFETRQLKDVIITPVVAEFRAQVYVDSNGNKYVPPFPDGVNSYVQYGDGVKSLVVELAVYQMIPYERVAEFFASALGINISTGTIHNYIRKLYTFLEGQFVPWAKYTLVVSPLDYFDETPINISGQYGSALVARNDKVILILAFPDRKIVSLIQMGILPNFEGVAMSDCYLGTLHFSCLHVLCLYHLLRELKGVNEKDGMRWATLIKNFFKNLIKKVEDAGGEIPFEEYKKEIKHLNNLITRGFNEIQDKLEQGCLGDKSKATALLKRIQDKIFEYTVFSLYELIPAGNNAAERALRMLKVCLKISGCFKSLETANEICVIRSYLDTCKNYGVSPHDAISLGFKFKSPDFIDLKSMDPGVLERIHKAEKYEPSPDDTMTFNELTLEFEAKELKSQKQYTPANAEELARRIDKALKGIENYKKRLREICNSS